MTTGEQTLIASVVMFPIMLAIGLAVGCVEMIWGLTPTLILGTMLTIRENSKIVD